MKIWKKEVVRRVKKESVYLSKIFNNYEVKFCENCQKNGIEILFKISFFTLDNTLKLMSFTKPPKVIYKIQYWLKSGRLTKRVRFARNIAMLYILENHDAML